MTILDKNTIDMLGRDEKTGTIILGITDHLTWDDISTHLDILIHKLDTTIQFIMNGQILEKYPESKEARIEIRIYFQYQPPVEGEDLLNKVREKLHNLNEKITLTSRVG